MLFWRSRSLQRGICVRLRGDVLPCVYTVSMSGYLVVRCNTAAVPLTSTTKSPIPSDGGQEEVV